MVAPDLASGLDEHVMPGGGQQDSAAGGRTFGRGGDHGSCSSMGENRTGVRRKKYKRTNRYATLPWQLGNFGSPLTQQKQRLAS
jgi:hypothetical protein